MFDVVIVQEDTEALYLKTCIIVLHQNSETSNGDAKCVKKNPFIRKNVLRSLQMVFDLCERKRK